MPWISVMFTFLWCYALWFILQNIWMLWSAVGFFYVLLEDVLRFREKYGYG